MADHPHTIDRWDDATGENLIEQIAAVGDYLVALANLPRGGEALAKGQDHAAQPGAGHRRLSRWVAAYSYQILQQ